MHPSRVHAGQTGFAGSSQQVLLPRAQAGGNSCGIETFLGGNNPLPLLLVQWLSCLPPRLKEAGIQSVSIYSNNVQLPWQRGGEEMQLLHPAAVRPRLLGRLPFEP